MKIEIDQSGKIEDTARPTVLAYSNGEQYTIIISAVTKRQLQEFYRRRGQPKLFIYQLFAFGVFFLLRHLRESCVVVIDTEYPGKDKILFSMISTLISLHRLPDHTIRFARIGNHPRVHYAAKNVLDKKTSANEVITQRIILNLIKKADGRLRECFATLVDAQARSFLHYKRKKTSVKQKGCNRSGVGKRLTGGNPVFYATYPDVSAYTICFCLPTTPEPC